MKWALSNNSIIVMWYKKDLQAQTYLYLPNLLTHNALYFLIGFSHKRDSIPLQDLHSCRKKVVGKKTTTMKPDWHILMVQSIHELEEISKTFDTQWRISILVCSRNSYSSNVFFFFFNFVVSSYKTFFETAETL